MDNTNGKKNKTNPNSTTKKPKRTNKQHPQQINNIAPKYKQDIQVSHHTSSLFPATLNPFPPIPTSFPGDVYHPDVSAWDVQGAMIYPRRVSQKSCCSFPQFTFSPKLWKILIYPIWFDGFF